jgi:hypothetical protein
MSSKNLKKTSAKIPSSKLDAMSASGFQKGAAATAPATTTIPEEAPKDEYADDFEHEE